jgi:hypothetical protein
MGDRHRPAYFRGLCTPSEGKLGSRPRAYRIALLRIPSMVVCCFSLNTPRCMAWYLDFNSCSIAVDLREGLGLRFPRAFASTVTEPL